MFDDLRFLGSMGSLPSAVIVDIALQACLYTSPPVGQQRCYPACRGRCAACAGDRPKPRTAWRSRCWASGTIRPPRCHRRPVSGGSASDWRVRRRQYVDAELAATLTPADLAFGPVRRSVLVSLHMTAEPRADRGSAGTVEPFSLEHLGRKPTDAAYIGDQDLDLVGRSPSRDRVLAQLHCFQIDVTVIAGPRHHA
jgi:hypothetical protein